METLTQRARNHYQLVLLRNKGLTPWCKFITDMVNSKTLADKTRSQFLAKRTFKKWQIAAGQRSVAREHMADELRCQQLLRKYLRAWKQVLYMYNNNYSAGMNIATLRGHEFRLSNFKTKTFIQ